MSGKRSKKTNKPIVWPLLFFLVLLASVAALLLARSRQSPPSAGATPEPAAAVSPLPELTPLPELPPTPEPSPSPTPEPLPTPCTHIWSDGVCTSCGEVCSHAMHDPESALCLLCGEQRYHRYESGVCTGCGREPVLYTEPLPDRYYTDAEHPGQRLRDSYPYDGGTYPLAIWLPWDYDENEKYNVVLLMPGDKTYLSAWIDMPITAPNERWAYCMANVYDHIAEEHLCAPFIVVGISNYAGMNESRAGKWICEGILPYLAEHYATWAEDGSPEALKSAREHFAIGGLSRGSIQTYDVGMCWCLDYIANFAAFSNMSNAAPTADCLNSSRNRDLSIRCYYATWGAQDKDYCARQEEGYHFIVDHVERLTEGVNAFGQEINGNHSWNTWSTSFFDAIQYLF